MLNPKYLGKGSTPEATNALIEYAFNTLDIDIDIVWSGHFDFNTNSKGVIEKCGFKYRFSKDEKLKLLDNKQVTTLYYNILRSEYIND